MPACDDDLSRAACFVQKSGIQLRSEHAGTGHFVGSENIGLRSYFRATEAMRQTQVKLDGIMRRAKKKGRNL